jgi:general secretion pathway protein C
MPQVITDPAPPAPPPIVALAGDIVKVDSGHYKVSRALVDRMLESPMSLMKEMRIVPSITDGKPNGFKLYAIRPGSIFERLGLQNGDTLVTINGRDLTSPDKALETYTRLRSSTQLIVGLRRRGVPVYIVYQLV